MLHGLLCSLCFYKGLHVPQTFGMTFCTNVQALSKAVHLWPSAAAASVIAF